MIVFIKPPIIDKHKTPFQELDLSLINDDDIINLIFEYMKAGNWWTPTTFPTKLNDFNTGRIEDREITCHWLLERIYKHHKELLDKYSLLIKFNEGGKIDVSSVF